MTRTSSHMTLLRVLAWGAGFNLICQCALPAQDFWPTYMHDNRRSGVVQSPLKLPLKTAWTRHSQLRPRTAWTNPAPWDSYARKVGLTPMRLFDKAFFVTTVDDSVWFGSSVDHGVHCLDAGSGKERWVFFAEGPVRLPPTFANGRLYFGSDDGFAYCIDAELGKQVWKVRGAPADKTRQFPKDGAVGAMWPVMTGVLVDGDRAWFGASLLPWEKSYLCAVDAETGSLEGEGRFRRETSGMTLQGAMLASTTMVYSPQGRLAPARFDKIEGKPLGTVGAQKQGGVYALLTPESHLIHGRGVFKGGVTESAPANKDVLVTYAGGRSIVVTAERSFLLKQKELVCIDRARLFDLRVKRREISGRHGATKKSYDAQRKQEAKDEAKIQELRQSLLNVGKELDENGREQERCLLWTAKTAHPHSMIMVGDYLVCGGDGEVVIVDKKQGKVRWRAKVDGRAEGLAASAGRVYVSTDRGTIHAFVTR
jgi:outer membrane protein assembly factor BamB